MNLDTVEDKYMKIINQNSMVEEDFRGQAGQNYHKVQVMKLEYADLQEVVK